MTNLRYVGGPRDGAFHTEGQAPGGEPAAAGRYVRATAADGQAIYRWKPAATEPVTEVLLTAPVSTLPGTDLDVLGQQLADAVAHLPVPAAALVRAGKVPDDVRDAARALGERQGMATAAADTNLYFVRLWLRPSAALPGEALAVAVACRAVWEKYVLGIASGLADVVCLPAPEEIWRRGALESDAAVVRTRNEPPGLIPAE
ncbi:hypothetical protein [Streptomyces sp. NPDC018059]|uniref:hypothetical protein n=1 Tax=Streptomyces sp. NPDC018059 TaxID=3365041 RepID=UPI0037876F76